jgi:LacI family repressor for deo operon, udp, cdd, tsx, nupC, and nupG
MPTIFDVARQAEVSIATVSRVLSQRDPVSQSVRQRVLKAVEELGYEPNRAARALRTLRAAKILVTVPDISNPFFANVIRGAEEAARAADYAVVIGDTRHDPALESQYAAMLPRKEVDGLVFLGHRLPETLQAMIAADGARAPVVNGCEYSKELGVSSVHIDNAAAGAEATEHLISLGHRRIGVITGPLISPISRDRLNGVRDAATRRKLVDELRIRNGDFSVESGHDEAARLIAEERVTAIFCFSDEMAIGALAAARAAKLSCPKDISIVGFDDIRFANYLEPALTTIAQPSTEIGKRTVKILLSIIDGKRERMTSQTLPHKLVIRNSTGPLKKR